ncbi:MAG: S8 family serine peptidase [Candidatus Omnitrophica bacterium]|nr:S8 family serine peptidase [Candidatus Omnitrophota bacterium]
MKPRTTVFLCLFLLTSFINLSSTLAADQKSPAETYLDELYAQGKERVIVSFKDDATVDSSLVDKYSGKLIRVFTTIKALVCEIPEANIEAFKNEPSVKSISPDTIVKSQPGSEERDPQELREFNRLKREYLRKIRAAQNAARQEALQEYLQSLRSYLVQMRRLTALHNAAPIKLKKIYQRLISLCNARQKAALKIYMAKLDAARNVYVTALSDTEIAVNEGINLMYSGPATVRWNNLEAGLNSKAAWDRYDLDGTGIKIAIIDTGINYMVADLGGGMGPGFKCLGGYDFVDDDGDPINPAADEAHGTEVAALAVGAGAYKVVGVAYNANYYALRVAQGANISTALVSDVMSAIEWASTEPHKADIISMSLGVYDEDQAGNPLWPFIKQEFEAVCNNAYNAGVVLVAASGNRGYNHSSYPAAFANVISVGAHAEDQTIYDYLGYSSNGGVDIVAPGAHVYSIHPDNSAWWTWGTSVSTPHAAGLLALQLQYARQNNIQPNNGYLWELMNHSSKNIYLDPLYQGKGKAWLADTIPPPTPRDEMSPPWEPKDGGIDCMAEKWPLSYSFVYDNYAFIDRDGYPAYYIGTTMYQDITLTNNTNTSGNYPDYIENLNITTTQAYYQAYGEAILPGAPEELLYDNYISPPYMDPGEQLIQSDTYYLPWTMHSGLDRTILNLEFEFLEDTNNRLIKVTYPYASIWCPPAIINEGFPVAE